MTFDQLSAALLTVTDNVGHYEVTDKSDQYIVWAEDGSAGSLFADDILTDQVITGTIDYFTKTENDPNFSTIQTVLGTLDLCWRFNSVQSEDDTGYIHYEWVWEMSYG